MLNEGGWVQYLKLLAGISYNIIKYRSIILKFWEEYLDMKETRRLHDKELRNA
jgi:hypothetical protein